MENRHQQALDLSYLNRWDWKSPLGVIVNLLALNYIFALLQRAGRWLCKLYRNVIKHGRSEGFLKTPLIRFPQAFGGL